jgi:hypothetical protein
MHAIADAEIATTPSFAECRRIWRGLGVASDLHGRCAQ